MGRRAEGWNYLEKSVVWLKAPLKKKALRSSTDDNTLNIHASLNLKSKRQPMHKTEHKKLKPHAASHPTHPNITFCSIKRSAGGQLKT